MVLNTTDRKIILGFHVPGKIRFLFKGFAACVVILSVIILLNSSVSLSSSRDEKKSEQALAKRPKRELLNKKGDKKEHRKNQQADARSDVDSKNGFDASRSTDVSSKTLKNDDDKFAQQHGFHTYTPPPGWTTSEVPQRIRELAVRTIGETKAEEFFLTVGCSKFVFQGKTVWMWHNKHDTPDWNPGYKFEKAQKTAIAIDVGANIGDTAVCLMIAKPSLQVISFEPSPFTFLFASWNVLHNGFSLLSESDLGTNKPGVLVLWGGATNDGREIELIVSLWNTKHSSMRSKGLGLDYDIPCTFRDCATQPKLIRNEGKVQKLARIHEAKWSAMKVPSYSIPQLLKKTQYFKCPVVED